MYILFESHSTIHSQIKYNLILRSILNKHIINYFHYECPFITLIEFLLVYKAFKT
jgi:hypothetical protein